jgi:molecular chaperone GrpE (heat shock protein)
MIMEMSKARDGQANKGHLTYQASEESPSRIEHELLEDPDGCVLDAADDVHGFRSETSSQIASKVDECLAMLSDLAQLIRGRQATDEAFTKLQQGYQALVEQFHEREVLQPMFLQLIAIADRCREKIARLEAFLGRQGTIKDSAKRDLVRYLVSTRRADLTEFENILANFGVAPFEHPEESFDRSVQFCMVRTVADRPGLIGKIARRLRPGYRRNAQVIRPEFVAVYVPGPNGPQ